jgi:hypothetical protein
MSDGGHFTGVSLSGHGTAAFVMNMFRGGGMVVHGAGGLARAGRRVGREWRGLFRGRCGIRLGVIMGAQIPRARGEERK